MASVCKFEVRDFFTDSPLLRGPPLQGRARPQRFLGLFIFWSFHGIPAASQGLKSPKTNCREKANSCNKVLQNYSKGFFCFSVGHEKYDYYYYYEKSFFCSFKREPLREKEQNREEVRSTYGFRFSSAQEGLKVHSI